MTENCLFCKIAHGDIPVELVYQDDLVAAFRDIHPQAPTHLLIVPKQHIPDALALSAADGELLARVMTVAANLAQQEGIAVPGFRIVINTGPAAGQTVQHLHFHLLGGRELGWPPG
jgi:histidine triad (HIT) family protein